MDVTKNQRGPRRCERKTCTEMADARYFPVLNIPPRNQPGAHAMAISLPFRLCGKCMTKAKPTDFVDEQFEFELAKVLWRKGHIIEPDFARAWLTWAVDPPTTLVGT